MERRASEARIRQDFNLLALPDLVKTYLSQYLNLSSLTNFRLVCRNLKEIVEQPSVLADIPITIRSSKQLQSVLDTQVPFNNFTLSFQTLENQSHLYAFAGKFGGHMRKLCIKTHGGYVQKLMMLEKCKKLDELEMADMNFELLASQNDIGLFECVSDNLKNVRRLVIHHSSEWKGRVEIDMFLKLLFSCSVLEELKIPNFTDYNLKLIGRHAVHNRVIQPERVENEEDNWEWEDENVDLYNDDRYHENGRDILIDSIIKYITSTRHLRRINISAVRLFGWNVFSDFIRLCEGRNIKIIEATSCQFSCISNEIANMDAKYYKVIHSARLAQLHNRLPIFKMNNLRRLSLEICPFSSDGSSNVGDNDHVIYDFPKLQHLRVQFMFSVNEQKNQNLIRKIFKEGGRPTVEKLQLEWCLQELGPTIVVHDLTSNFCNLKQLEVFSWILSDDGFIILWKNLLLLEKLTIKDCKNLTDRAFVGNYNLKDSTNIPYRPLNRLKKLHSLSIRDVSGKVTQIAMLESFKYIRLQYFEFVSTVIDAIDISVYQSMANSPFGQSIEYFSGPRPVSRSRLNIKTVLKGFKNLKRPFK